MHRLTWLASQSLILLCLASSCEEIEIKDRRRSLEADGGGYEDDPDASARDREPDAMAPDASDGSAPDASAPEGGSPANPDPPKPADPTPTDPQPTNPDAGAPQQVAADTDAITSRARLVQFERATGRIARSASIGGLRDGERILGADIRPANGKLYALSDGARLYEVNLESGSAALAATLMPDPSDMTTPFESLQGERFGVDFNPVGSPGGRTPSRHRRPATRRKVVRTGHYGSPVYDRSSDGCRFARRGARGCGWR